MEIPVYLYVGFLEGGKTTKIREDLTEGRFAGYRNILLLQCEDGTERLDEQFLRRHQAERVFLKRDDIAGESLERLSDRDKWDCILIEYHGIWPLRPLLQSLPGSWRVRRKVVCADAGMFPVQYKNMDRLVAEKIYGCDELVFHSAEGAERAKITSIVRLFHPDVEIPF